MKRNRAANREVIDLSDDDSTKDLPTLKVAKMEPELAPPTLSPAQEVIELRQKVAKLDKDFKGACRYARQFELGMEAAQKRVEVLENQANNKPAVVDETEKKRADGLQKKLAETTAELGRLRQSAASSANASQRLLAMEQSHTREARRRIDELLSTPAAYRIQQLEGERLRLCEESQRDKQRLAELWSLTQEREVETAQVSAERKKDKERIEELSRKLEAYQSGSLPPPPPPPPPTAELQKQQRTIRAPSFPLIAGSKPIAKYCENPSNDSAIGGNYQRKKDLVKRGEELLNPLIRESMFADAEQYKNTRSKIISACIGKEQKINPRFDYSFSEEFKRGVIQYTQQYVKRHNLTPRSRHR